MKLILRPRSRESRLASLLGKGRPMAPGIDLMRLADRAAPAQA
jgi:hypothetical protein